MPPRPRPRPKPRPAVNEPSVTSPAAGASPPLPTQDDEDKLFLRNNNLTTQAWKRLNKRSEEAVLVVDLEQNQDDSPRKNRKRQAVNKSVPSWTLPQARAGLNDAVDVDELDDLYADDSESDVGSSSRRINHSPKKAKRKRSRSRSITPPPILTFAQVQVAKNIVRTALGMGPRRAPSPKASAVEDLDESTDTIILDPELASFARAVKSESYLRSHSTPVEDDAPAVSIKVRWKPHPLNKEGQPQVHSFIMKRTDTFRQVFDEVADLHETLVDDLVVSFKGRQIYSSVSLSSMNIWEEGELDAFARQTYEYMRMNNIRFQAVEQRSASPAADSGGGSSDSDSDDMSQAPHGAPDTFKLTLRSEQTSKDIVLTVRPSTKCGAIVKAFLKKAGLLDKYLGDPAAAGKTTKRGRKSTVVIATGPNLMVDGDKMDNDAEIEEAGLEDGDMVEVVGL